MKVDQRGVDNILTAIRRGWWVPGSASNQLFGQNRPQTDRGFDAAIAARVSQMVDSLSKPTAIKGPCPPEPSDAR